MDQEDQDGDGAGVRPQPSVPMKRKMTTLEGAYNYFKEKNRLVVFKLGEMTLEQTITENAYLNGLLDLLILVRLFITLPRAMLQYRKMTPREEDETAGSVLLQIGFAKVKSVDDEKEEAVTFWDPGTTISLIQYKFAELLKLKGQKCNIWVQHAGHDT